MPNQYVNNANTATTTSLSDAILRVYSKEILFWAQPVLKYDQFAVQRTELGVTPGKVVSMLRYNNLTPGGRLTEGTAIPIKQLTSELVNITVYEYGNAVNVSEYLLQTSFDDVMSSAAKLLGFDMAKVIDCLVRDAFLSASNVLYAKGKDARSELVAGDSLDVTLLKDANEFLKSMDAPQLGAGYYVCFAHPHQLRGLRDDPNWISAHQYAAPENLFNGEAGRIEDIIFIETTMQPNGASGTNTVNPYAYKQALAEGQGGNQTDIYQAVVFGDNAVGRAIALPVEMRDNGVTDFGREHGLAWYTITGADILTGRNIVILETA